MTGKLKQISIAASDAVYQQELLRVNKELQL